MTDPQGGKPTDADATLARLRSEMENFMHAVSHDLRAPLRHITAYGQMVQEQLAAGGNTQEALAYTGIMVQSAQRMGLLIDGMVELSRLGQVELQRMPLRMADLIAEAQRAVADQAPGRAIEWIVAPDFPIVQGDPALIRLVWQHLLSNALKFTAAQPLAQVQMGWERGPRQDSCSFFVRDNGAGFNPAFVSQLFNAFQRLHSAKQFPGVGVGLASCRKIVERHGGSVQAEGAVGDGCTVRFTLPI
jgi:light-regulated signal transduction histidine kinase (bacteriophytochrome)